MWSIRTKKKMKEQNSSRYTKPKNGLTVTKGKGNGEDVWEGRDKGWEKKGGIMISRYSVCGGTWWAVQYREEE